MFDFRRLVIRGIKEAVPKGQNFDKALKISSKKVNHLLCSYGELIRTCSNTQELFLRVILVRKC